MSAPTPGTLEEQASKRRERLLALKRKREGKSDSTEPSSKHQETEDDLLPKPIFRSYKPLDEKLKDNALLEIKPDDVIEQVKEQLESAKSQIVMDQLDVTSLAPRKPDWDLKRDTTKKLEKLERQTQKAIAELIRERLKERKEDLAMMVNAGATNFEREQ
ncbi:coiled-coil domain-containing protein 12 [Anthonomus grandis grandis]|uniref:coiled-coil domain-containing protein 12 n=1 Tax=Anthonomus grandis grandis TaxID=2921223 RepID=UPI002165D028|nr:coiled-coil domain-containing protein 12 [Anthonomus grandis grandis]XP_050304378.1 coiled-coil domain-containing protein 12 [Anthonomus grandis grandis]